MDLNYLYHRHQVSLFNADNARCDESRRAHLSLVAAYAARIAEAKQRHAQPQLLRAEPPVPGGLPDEAR